MFHIGDKNYLLQNSGNAHSTRILRNGKELLDVVATNLHVSSNVLCAQSITNFEISRDGGITNVYRIFYNLCTSGKVHKQVWTLGEHVSVSSSVEYHDLVWYLRFPYQPNTYTLSATGIIGNFEDLKTSIQNGAEVFLLKDISFRPLTGVKIEGNTIYTQNIWEISISGTAYQSDAYYFMRTYNSDSLQRHIIRYYVDSDQFRNPTLNFEPSNVYWHVNDAWVLELETDGSGNRLQGCVANLLTKIRGGHRVRIGSQSMYDEATAIWIHNGVIWAQTIDSLSTTANLFDTNPAYRIVRMCSTSGMFYVYKVHIHGGTHSLFEQGVSAMRWFVDKQRWTSVYENGAYINPYTSQLLLDSGQRFKIILKLTDYHLLLNGERIFENESTGVLQLGSYKHFRITIQGNNLLLQLPPEWDIYHASSDGQVDHLTWAYDAAQLKSEDVLTCNMTWFAEKWLFPRTYHFIMVVPDRSTYKASKQISRQC